MRILALILLVTLGVANLVSYSLILSTSSNLLLIRR